VRAYLSRFIIALSWALVSFPISYLLVLMFAFGIPARNVLTLIVSPFYLALSALAVFTGFQLREAKPMSWYTFIAVNIGTAYLNFVMAAQFARAEFWTLSLITFSLLQIAIIARMSREIRVPYIIPQVRWWDSDPRSRIILPARIRPTSETSELPPCEGDVLDFSLMGCFIRMRQPIELDERVRVEIDFYGTRATFSGIVVLKAGAAVTHPRGIGVKFTPQSKEVRRIHAAMDRRVKKLHNLFRTGRYLYSPEEYYRRVAELRSAPLALEIPRGIRLPLIGTRIKVRTELPHREHSDG